MIVNRVGPLSCAKIVGLLYVILGLIMGAFVSLFAVTMGGVPGRDPGNPVFGMAAVGFFPVLYCGGGLRGRPLRGAAGGATRATPCSAWPRWCFSRCSTAWRAS